MTPQTGLARATANAAPADTPPLEALDVLTDEADGRSGNIPPALLAAQAIRVTAGADFPVQKAALDALLRRLSSARAEDGLVVRGKPRGAAPFGLYRLKGRDSGREYRVLFRFRDPPKGSCECADFARSALGLCKHLLWLLDLSFASGPKRNAPAPELAPPPLPPPDGTRPLSHAAVAKWFARGPAPSPLKDEFADNPRKRLQLVRDLRAWGEGGGGLAIPADPALRNLLQREEAAISGVLESPWSDKELTRALGSLKRKLFPYQLEGVRRFLEAERLLLADDMGLGKTAQAIAAAHALFNTGRAQRGLIVVPAALKPQWEREWRLFSDVPVEVAEG